MLDQLLADQPVADAQPAQAGPFAERPQHRQVRALPDQVGHALAGELGVGLVDYHQQRQVEQTLDRSPRRRVAGRVVRRGDEQQLGTAALGGLGDRLRVERERLVARDLHHLRRLDAGVEGVHPERRRAVDDRVARPQERAHQHVDHLVGARAADDPLRRMNDVAAQGLAQQHLIGIGVDRVVAIGGQGLQRARRGAIGVLVGVQLDDPLDWQPQPRGQHVERRSRRVRLQGRDIRTHQVGNRRHSVTPIDTIDEPGYYSTMSML